MSYSDRFTSQLMWWARNSNWNVELVEYWECWSRKSLLKSKLRMMLGKWSLMKKEIRNLFHWEAKDTLQAQNYIGSTLNSSSTPVLTLTVKDMHRFPNNSYRSIKGRSLRLKLEWNHNSKTKSFMMDPNS